MQRRFAVSQPQTDHAQLLCGVGIGRLHDLERAVIHALAHRRVVMQFLQGRRSCRIDPASTDGPQICRVNAVSARQLLHFLKLREQSQRRARVFSISVDFPSPHGGRVLRPADQVRSILLLFL